MWDAASCSPLKDSACGSARPGEVNEGRHKVVGYTGHIPGQQHIYAQSYGRMTGNTLGPTQDHKFSKSLLYFKDARPQGAGRG